MILACTFILNSTVETLPHPTRPLRTILNLTPLEHISRYYPCTISFGGGISLILRHLLVQPGLMLSKAAPKTNKPAHKALQGWLRTDYRVGERERETKRQTEGCCVVVRDDQRP